jgi:hypothetical protein
MRRAGLVAVMIWVGVLVSAPLGVLAQGRTASSVWTASPIKVDGQAGEWQSDYLYFERTLDVDYAFRNDGRNLYILLVFRNPKLLEAVDTTGIAIHGPPQGTDGQPGGVRFIKKFIKADRFIEMLVNQGTPLTAEEMEKIRAVPRHPVFLAAAVDRRGRTLAPPPPGVDADPSSFAETMGARARTFEFRLPLASRDITPAGLGVSPGETVRLRFSWGGAGDKILAAKATWQSPTTGASGGVMTGSGEIRAQAFLSTFDKMSRPTTRGREYAFEVDVNLAAGPVVRSPAAGR